MMKEFLSGIVVGAVIGTVGSAAINARMSARVSGLEQAHLRARRENVMNVSNQVVLAHRLIETRDYIIEAQQREAKILTCLELEANAITNLMAVVRAKLQKD